MTHKSISLVLSALAYTIFSTTVFASSPPAKMTCKEFVEMEEVSRPKLVYWFDGFDRKGRMKESVDFVETDRLVPLLIEECTKNPNHLLATKIKTVKKVKVN